ncbi:MAG: methyltransferase domain-containing protein [Thermoanaerobaculia bacterium]
MAPPRIETHEHLDDADAPTEEVLRSLDDLRRINRWFGGTWAYRHLLRRLTTIRSLAIADLGTGTSDLLALTDGIASRRIGLDIKLHHLAYGRALGNDGVDRVAANAFRIPLRDDSVDVVTSSHLVHHFDEEKVVAILREALRVARIGVAMSDTRRHWVPLLFTRAVAKTPLWGPITRHDAPASIAQAYTMGEMRAIAARAGARRWDVVPQIAFRAAVLLWK